MGKTARKLLLITVDLTHTYTPKKKKKKRKRKKRNLIEQYTEDGGTSPDFTAKHTIAGKTRKDLNKNYKILNT